MGAETTSHAGEGSTSVKLKRNDGAGAGAGSEFQGDNHWWYWSRT